MLNYGYQFFAFNWKQEKTTTLAVVAIVGREIPIGSIEEKKLWNNVKKVIKDEAKRLRATVLELQSCKSDNKNW